MFEDNELIETVSNPNSDQLWQQAGTFASQQAPAQPLTPDRERKRYVLVRSNEYKRLRLIEREQLIEHRRAKSPEELETIKQASEAEDRLNREVADMRHNATVKLEHIRSGSSGKLTAMTQRLQVLMVLVLAGLAEPEDEAELIEQIAFAERQQQAALSLGGGAAMDRVLDTVEQKMRAQAFQPIGRI